MNSKELINIADIYQETRTLGPGLRYVIWVRGCHKNCTNCISKDWQQNDNNYISYETLLEEILAKKDKLEGITLSGGEPFLQAYPLSLLFKKIKALTNLSIIVYTGYRIEELYAKDDIDIINMINESDIIIDGEYIEELNNDRGIIGSQNQRFNFITDRYKNDEQQFRNCKREVEININKSLLIGVPPKKLLPKNKEK